MKIPQTPDRHRRGQPAATAGERDAARPDAAVADGRLAQLQASIAQSPQMQAQRRVVQGYASPQVPAQRQPDGSEAAPAQAVPDVNRTGLPDSLKAGIESLSGLDMSGVRVHRASGKPAQLNASAYAQGNDIHLGPGQERHLPHEAWHLVQQRQGRVKATTQVAGTAVNDNAGLEREADVMGTKAAAGPAQRKAATASTTTSAPGSGGTMPAQLGRDDVNSKEFGYYGRDGTRKNRRVIDMEAFGDRNRLHRLDPNKLREFVEDEDDAQRMGIDLSETTDKDGKKGRADISKDVGIWRPSRREGSARPEDPPLYQPFRKAFHEAHNIKLALERDWPAFAQFNAEHHYGDRLLDYAGEVKAHSLAYKKQVRSFEVTEEVSALQDVYFGQLREVTVKVEALSKEMLEHSAPSGGGALAALAQGHVQGARSEQGEAIWRDRWWASVQAVNERLGSLWSTYRPQIEAWMTGKREEGLSYMNPRMLGDLDYIGSLAKGYKSAPKQYIRFMPEKFDIDANLDAPPLAVYAISAGAAVDRGSVKSEKIPPLRSFEAAVNNAMAGLLPEEQGAKASGEGEIAGVDKSDPFEVFIRATNVSDVDIGSHGDVTEARRKVGLGDRLQKVQDRIWWLRSRNMGLSKQLGGLLQEEGFLTPAKTLKEAAAEGAEPAAHQRRYTDGDLIVLEAALTHFEKEDEAARKLIGGGKDGAPEGGKEKKAREGKRKASGEKERKRSPGKERKAEGRGSGERPLKSAEKGARKDAVKEKKVVKDTAVKDKKRRTKKAEDK